LTQHDNHELALDSIHPPCQSACPVNQGVRDYLLAIATGDFDRALAIIKETNPLPFVCGTICAHHCEDECRRNDVDKPPSIRGLKRFAVENGKAKIQPLEGGPKLKGKVAVIGAGPSGLTAAFDLARQGAEVTVFEREESAGGAVRHYIPLYRLPDEAVDQDIDEIAEQGVDFKYGVDFGKDITIDQLKEEGYKSVVLALGLPVSKGLNIPGTEGDGVLYALPFLKAVKREGFKFEGSPTVVVIGGGNVAMDVARSALRAGAANVKLACLECDDEMPAFEWEIEEAREEGVEFNTSWGPDKIARDGDKVTGLEVVECSCVFDPDGRFNPEFNRDNRKVLDADIVIYAIGQGGDPEPLRDQVELNERGIVVFNSNKMTTSREGVFSCGEMITGPGSAVQAMGNGRLAAQAVSAYLLGKDFDVAKVEYEQKPELEKLDEKVAGEVGQMARHEIPMLTPEERVKHFKQAEIGYDAELAVCEARRCLTCAAGAAQDEDLCVHCLTCVRVCPYDVPIVNAEGKVEVRNEQCQACGLCISFCPVYAIKFRAPYVEEAVASIEPAVEKMVAGKNGKDTVLAITCSYGAFALPEFVNREFKDIGVVRYPCVAKLDTAHLLKAVEAGADKVVVVGCKESDKFECQYKDVSYWSQRKAVHASDLMEMLGMERECIAYTEIAGEELNKFEELIAEALTKPEPEEEEA